MNIPAISSPERPHEHESTDQLKAALVRTGREAQQYAQTGPKKYEDMLHLIADEFLDELRQRGAI